MPEKNTEIKRKTTNKEVEKFLALGIENYGKAIGRWSLEPSKESTKPLGTEPLIIAKSLSTIEIKDPNLNERVTEILEEPEKMTMGGRALVTAVFVGKAEVKNKGFLTPKEKKDLSKLTDTVIDGALERIAGKKGKVLRWASILTVLTAACSAKITSPNPDLTPMSEPVPAEYIPAPTESVPPPTKEAVAEFPEEEISQLQEQLKAQGLETEIIENEEEFILNDINRTKAVEIGIFRLEGDQCVFVVIKSNGEEIAYPVSQLGIDEEDNRLVIKDETGRINFRYYPELQKLKQEIEFPYLELSTESGRFNLRIGESMEDDIKSIEWNNDIPPLRYQDPETGEIRMLSPQERFDEAVFVALWSLASTSGLNPGVTLEQVRQGTVIKYENNKGEIVFVDAGKSFNIIFTYSNLPEGQKFSRNSITKFLAESDETGRLNLYILVGTRSFLEGYGVDWKEHMGDSQLYGVFRALSNPRAMRGEWPSGIRFDAYERFHPAPEIIQALAELIFQLDHYQMSVASREIYDREGPTRFAKKGPENNLIIIEIR